MEQSLIWRILVILVVVGLATFVVATREVPKGIDIAGGVSLLYEIQWWEVEEKSRTGLTERTTSVVRKRLDPEGVRELTIRPMGQYQFEVQMPKQAGADDQDIAALVEEAKGKVGRIGHLEFRLLADDEAQRLYGETKRAPEGTKIYPVARDSQKKLSDRGDTQAVVRIDDGYDLTGAYLDSVGRGFDEQGRPAVSFTFNDLGAKRFGRLTGRNIGKHLAIILDGQIQSAPVIRSRIDTRGIIEGGGDGFKEKELKELIAVLNAGSLDAPLNLLSEKVVGGQMGEENIQRAIRAILWAAILILAFMAVYYLVAGLVANFALALNVVLVLAVMSLLDATLTLPGMAGLVLTVGMAVDANVLIFERIREETRTHLALPLAIKNGYERAFRTIVDANVTTLIAAGALRMFGSEAVRGFGTTLGLGLLCSMFTALFVTRVVFTGMTLTGMLKRLPMLRLVRDTRINFVRFRRTALIVSLVVIAAGLVLFLRRPFHDNLGMDFTGGTAIGFTLKQPKEVTWVKERLATSAGYPDASVQTVRREGEEAMALGTAKSFLITVRDPERDTVGRRLHEALRDELPEKAIDFGVAFEPIPDDLERGTAGRRTYAGGLRTTVTLTPAIPETDLNTRISNAMEWASGQNRSFGPYDIDITREVANDVEQFALLSEAGGPDRDAVQRVLDRAFKTSPFTEVSSFGSKVAAGMKRDALVAMGFALVLILIYVRIRFGRWMYGLGAIVALIHDVLVTLSFLALGYILAPTIIGRALMIEDFKINLVLIAAFLTIIGYSINDTIVVFDRIRENLGGRKDRRVTPEVVNDSVNQVLSRTLLTSMTTLVVVVTLFIFGGTAVHGFAFAMIIGVIVGTYSSVYIAPPFLLGWTLPAAVTAEAKEQTVVEAKPQKAQSKRGKKGSKKKSKKGRR